MSSAKGDDAERAAGLRPGQRYRCGHCGNLTRFDVETTERVRRFWHVDLAGFGRAERTEQLDVFVERVECHWCGDGAAIEVVDAPAVGGKGPAAT